MDSEQHVRGTDAYEVELCCRVCLQLEDLMVNIYDEGLVEDLQSDLITLLERCGGIKVQECDSLPKFLCQECTTELLVAAKFREKCDRTQQLLSLTKWKDENNLVGAFPIDAICVDTSKEPENICVSQLIDTQSNIFEMHPEESVEINLKEIEVEDELSVSAELGATVPISQGELKYEESSYNEHLNEDVQSAHQVEVPYKYVIEEETDEIDGRIETLDPGLGKADKEQKHEHMVFTCDACGAVFLQPFNLRRHLEKVHSLLQPYICHNCNHTFMLEESFKSHRISCIKLCSPISTKTTDLSGNVFANTSATSAPRKCQYCGKHMQSTFALNMHLRTHTGERPYKCTKCPKAFKTQSACSMHLKRHAKKPDYACSICNKTFYETSNLTAHLRTHTGEKPHSCSLCQKRFSRVFLLQLHMRTHTGEKPYQCTTCNRSFAQLCDLKNHERIHTGERCFKCSICGKSFIKRYALKAHLERHAALQAGNITATEKTNEGTLGTTVVEAEDESINYMLENSILDGDSYYLPKANEDSFCDLAYTQEPPLNGPNQELAWNDFIVEEI